MQFLSRAKERLRLMDGLGGPGVAAPCRFDWLTKRRLAIRGPTGSLTCVVGASTTREPGRSSLDGSQSGAMTRRIVVGSRPSRATSVGKSWSGSPFISMSARAVAKAADTDCPSAKVR